MTLEGFDEWDLENKTKYPVRFFLQETLTDFVYIWFYVLIKKPLVDLRWGITYRLFKKHQYHIIRPRTLNPNFCDEETRILHAVMECLVAHAECNADYIDGEHPPEELEETYAVIHEVYEWWTKDHPRKDIITVKGTPVPLLPLLPAEWGDMAILRKEYKDEPLIKQWREAAKQHTLNDEQWFDKEQEMLIKVIKIRKNLWD